MADEPEENVEQTTGAAETAAPETGDRDVSAHAETPSDTAGAGSPLTPKERKAARRAERGVRRPATPEERAEERAAKRVARSRYRRNRRERDAAKRGEAGPKHTTSTVEHGPGAPKERLGIVVSDKADKTITVRIDVTRRHRRYQKIVRSSTTLHAHDEANEAHIGDRVRVIESRPLSATKRWRLTEVLERAK